MLLPIAEPLDALILAYLYSFVIRLYVPINACLVWIYACIIYHTPGMKQVKMFRYVNALYLCNTVCHLCVFSLLLLCYVVGVGVDYDGDDGVDEECVDEECVDDGVGVDFVDDGVENYSGYDCYYHYSVCDDGDDGALKLGCMSEVLCNLICSC